MSELEFKHCPNCNQDLPLTEEFFYPNRKKERVKVGWQSYCRDCWPTVNRRNKENRKRIKSYV